MHSINICYHNNTYAKFDVFNAILVKIKVFLNKAPFRFLNIFKPKKRRIPGDLNFRNRIVITDFCPSRYANLRVIVIFFLASIHTDWPQMECQK